MKEANAAEIFADKPTVFLVTHRIPQKKKYMLRRQRPVWSLPFLSS